MLPVRAEPRAIVDIVLGVSSFRHRERFAIATFITLAAHGALYLWARQVERAVDPSNLQPRNDIELVLGDYVLPPPPPHPQRPEAPEAPRPRATSPKARAAAAAAAAAAAREPAALPPPPARAAAVVAQDPGAPVDLTSETIVTGTAQAYAGGITTSSGTQAAAVRELAPSSSSHVPVAAAADASSAVSLESEAWSCPWPPQVDLARIDEQIVVIRVVVDAAGTAESAKVLVDPGHGFGAAAARCAMRTRFKPARAPDGKPVRAQSPPIRVRFTR
jgi:protein TonB